VRWRGRFFLLLILLVVAYSRWARDGGSSPGGSGPMAPAATAQTVERPPLAGVERRPIPIDDTQPGAQASLVRNLYFVFDGSGSMNDRPDRGCHGDRTFKTKIEGAKWAVREFLKVVPADVNMGLYVFDARGQREVVPIGAAQRDSFTAAIDQIRAGGGTPLAEAIRFAADRLIRQYQAQLGYGEYRLVVITDGIADRIPQAATYAAQYGIPIYAIGLCIGADHPLRRYAVSYRAADSFTDLAAGLEATLAELPTFDAAEFGK
jgi:Ca-activated chloride channel family protein